MSGVVAGQVFSEDELELMLSWLEDKRRFLSLYDVTEELSSADVDLAAKIHGYLEPIACRVPE